MQGVVDWGTLLWIVGTMLAVGGAVAAGVTGVLLWLWKVVKERDTAAQLEKSRAQLVEQQLRQDLSDFKLEVARTYATKDGMTQALSRVEGAIQQLNTQIHETNVGLTQRLDRILDGRPAQGRSSRAG